ncbi:MAG: MoaD family protein [Nitrospinota bacterium]|nr:MAG: MoaD family protein [Nitrospinota bacterium]
MKVRAKFFAALQEITGQKEIDLEVPSGSTPVDLFNTLCQRYPQMERFRDSLLFSINLEFVSPQDRLAEGDEIAFIPPVSGGAGMESTPKKRFLITEDPLPVETLVDEVRTDASGAVVTFVGVVRNSFQGKPVHHLQYEAYKEMAEKKLEQIGTEVREKWPVEDMAIFHRVGKLDIGERSVVIVVAAPHRREAFAACEYAIDRLKEIVPIWKKEFWAGGADWR